MRYSTLKSLIHEGIVALQPESPWKDVEFIPGTIDDPGTSGRYIQLTRDGGTGLELEGMVDAVGYQVKVVGEQESYDDAEGLAILIDGWLLSQISSLIYGEWVVNIDRVGSPPVPLLVDDADRTHFVCSYVMTVKSALG